MSMTPPSLHYLLNFFVVKPVLMLISTDSVVGPSWDLDSAPGSGEPNPTGLWAPVAPALYRRGGGRRGTHAKTVLCPLVHLRDYRPSGCRKQREAHRHCTSPPLQHVDVDPLRRINDGAMEVPEATKKAFSC